MRLSSFFGWLCYLLVAPTAASQERPNLTGTWTLASEAPVLPSGRFALGLAQEITIWHDGITFAVTRMFDGGNVVVTHVLDGSGARSGTPGGLCKGDSQSVWTAAWQEDAVVTTLVGVIHAGATTQRTVDVRARFHAKSPETMGVE